MIKLIINGKEYKNCFIRVEWSGSIKTSARKLEISHLKGMVEYDIGSKIEFYVDDSILFYGTIFRTNTSTDETEESFTAYDMGIYLNKNNFVKNFYQQTPSEITKQILGELNIPVGKLPIDAVKCDFPAWDRSAYDIILMAYKIQHQKNGKIYSIVDNVAEIEVVEQGTLAQGITLSTATNIRQAQYSKNIENMINKVVLYEMKEDKPNIIGNKENTEDIKKYGIFQQVQEQDKTNASYLQVQNLLKGVEETATITCDGNVELESGYSVALKVSNISRINGIFLIESDTHSWEGADYTCDLELAFENIMNDIDVSTYPNKKTKKGAKTEITEDVYDPGKVGDS